MGLRGFLMVVWFGLVATAPQLLAQQADTSSFAGLQLDTMPAPKVRIIEPRKALLWSLAPAGGQIYNGRYWKAPLVYGAFVAIAATADFNTTNYNRLQKAYLAKLRGETHEFTGTGLDSPESLKRLRDSYDKRRQTSYVGVFLVYAMQSMEAFVDAHLMTFDTKDDLLELSLRPVLIPTPHLGALGGLGLSISF